MPLRDKTVLPSVITQSNLPVVESACAVLSAGQSTLPASLATLIPEATGVTATSNSQAVATATATTSFTGNPTTNSANTVSPNAASQTASTADADTSVVSDHSDGTGTSTGVLIGGTSYNFGTITYK
jgi:hypothetical protein